MKLISQLCDPLYEVKLTSLSNRLNIELFDEGDTLPADCTHILTGDSQGLSIKLNELKAPSATQVNFLSEKLLYRLRTSGKSQGLGKALGLARLENPLIVDATAGLGVDSFLMASLGCSVIMLEKSPLIHALLEDGLNRARADASHEIQIILQRMELIHCDALEWMRTQSEKSTEQPDVVYLDPMFPPRQKSAKVKKDIALLQTVLGEGNEENKGEAMLKAINELQALLTSAKKLAKHRVVVKQGGGKTNSKENEVASPSYQVIGKATHFEVYLT